MKTERQLGIPPENKGSLLSDTQIKKYLELGTIVISPFCESNVNPSSYDVSLGEYFYREQKPDTGRVIYSPWSEEDVKRVWGEPQKASVAKELFEGIGIDLPPGVYEDDLVILIESGETILSHTNEFIGGRYDITTSMQARSSIGRNFIEVCKCAGWGDTGYINRWTMEITNNSQHYMIPLVVGRRVAQIVFHQTGLPSEKDYSDSGKYQTYADLESLEANWKPSDMLPKMWKDREVAKRI